MPSIYKHSIFRVTWIGKISRKPEREFSVSKSSNSTASPQEKQLEQGFQRFCPMELTLSQQKYKNWNKRKHVVYHVKIDAYRYGLLIDTCHRNPMFGKYSLHYLHGQSVQSHFLTISLNWLSELICLKI